MLRIDGDTLRKARASNGLTQLQVSEIVGTWFGTVCFCEREKVDKQELRRRILTALNDYSMCYDYLLDHVSDIDYYDKDTAAADRQKMYAEKHLQKRLNKRGS